MELLREWEILAFSSVVLRRRPDGADAGAGRDAHRAIGSIVTRRSRETILFRRAKPSHELVCML
jgi:hypothetical protein